MENKQDEVAKYNLGGTQGTIAMTSDLLSTLTRAKKTSVLSFQGPHLLDGDREEPD